MIKGRSVKDCLVLTVEQLADALGGVPPSKLHAPALAIGALHNALRTEIEVTASAQNGTGRTARA
jgi:hypothetical protein